MSRDMEMKPGPLYPVPVPKYKVERLIKSSDALENQLNKHATDGWVLLQLLETTDPAIVLAVMVKQL